MLQFMPLKLGSMLPLISVIETYNARWISQKRLPTFSNPSYVLISFGIESGGECGWKNFTLPFIPCYGW